MSQLRQAICRAQEFFAEQLAEFTYHKGNKLTKAHVVHLGCIKHLLGFGVSLLGLCLGSVGPVRHRSVPPWPGCEPVRTSLWLLGPCSALIWILSALLSPNQSPLESNRSRLAQDTIARTVGLSLGRTLDLESWSPQPPWPRFDLMGLISICYHHKSMSQLCPEVKSSLHFPGYARESKDWGAIEAKDKATEAQNLNNEIQANQNHRCFSTCCTPNWRSRYNLSKQAVSIAKEMGVIYGEKNFEGVSLPVLVSPPISKPTAPAPVGHFMLFESRTHARDDVLKALKHDNNNIVGIHGMGGVGKDHNGETSSGKGHERRGKNGTRRVKKGRANQLREKIMADKRILVILDDIWESIDLSQVGIPFGCDLEACKSKILFTTRTRTCMPYNGMQNNSSCGKCQGLPLALETVAKALGDKDVEEWKKAKIIISVRIVLARYAMGLGLFRNAETLDQARGDVDTFIKNLIDSGLLLKSNKDGRVKMHDVVRDTAIIITSSGDEQLFYGDSKWLFMAKAGSGLQQWPRDRDNCFERYTAVSVMFNNIEILPNEPVCPNLQILLLRENKKLKEIPSGFFNNMKILKLLDLSNLPIKRLPPSIALLQNLCTLYMDQCRSINHISILGALKKLEILSLKYSRINTLPKELAELTELRLLDMTACDVQTIPPNIISRLHGLEELYLQGSFFEWGNRVKGTNEERNASLEESLIVQLSSGECLIDLAYGIPNNPVFENLQELCIYDMESMKEICIGQLPPGSFEKLKFLDVQRCSFLENSLLNSNIIQRFYNLEKLHLYQNSIREVFGFEGLHEGRRYLERLKEIRLDNLSELANIWKGPAQLADFKNLKTVIVIKCNKLKYLFSPSMSQGLLQLEELWVEDCLDLDAIIQKDDDITMDKIILPQLKTLALQNLAHLVNFYDGTSSSECPFLEYLHVQDCPNFRTSNFHSSKQVHFNNGGHYNLLKKSQDVRVSLFKCLMYFIHGILHSQAPTQNSGSTSRVFLPAKSCFNMDFKDCCAAGGFVDSETKKMDVEESDKISKTIKIHEDEIHVAELVDFFAKPDPSVCRYLMNYTKKPTRKYETASERIMCHMAEYLLDNYYGSRKVEVSVLETPSERKRVMCHMAEYLLDNYYGSRKEEVSVLETVSNNFYGPRKEEGSVLETPSERKRVMCHMAEYLLDNYYGSRKEEVSVLETVSDNFYGSMKEEDSVLETPSERKRVMCHMAEYLLDNYYGSRKEEGSTRTE
uniref:Uncharacterized protein n=2 Tax=Fagus sylvatica TaxID=28930 RepID=A0A2N9GCY6_FAGSY